MKALVLDYIDRKESPNEGMIIKYALKNMGWDVRLISKPDKGKFLKSVFGAWRTDVIHISAHGNWDSLSSTRKGRGTVSIGEIRDYFIERLNLGSKRLDNTELVLNSGCDTADERWATLFIDDLHAKHYVGARGDPTIAEGFLFPMHLYTELWSQPKRPNIQRAFENAISNYRRKEWKLYP